MEIKHIYTIDQIRKISNRRITELKSTMFLRAFLNAFLDIIIVGGLFFEFAELALDGLAKLTDNLITNMQKTTPDSETIDPIMMLYWLIGIYKRIQIRKPMTLVMG